MLQTKKLNNNNNNNNKKSKPKPKPDTFFVSEKKKSP
jgi:hypothetical protein